MKTLNSYNGCTKNSKKAIAEAKKLMEYDVPLTAYEEEEREFAAKYNIEVNIDTIPTIEDILIWLRKGNNAVNCSRVP